MTFVAERSCIEEGEFHVCLLGNCCGGGWDLPEVEKVHGACVLMTCVVVMT